MQGLVQSKSMMLPPLTDSARSPKMGRAESVPTPIQGECGSALGDLIDTKAPFRLPALQSKPALPAMERKAGFANVLPKKGLGKWGRARKLVKPITAEERRQKLAEKLQECRTCKIEADAAWHERRYDDCLVSLDRAIELNKHSDTLYRFRSKLHSKAGRFESALSDASRALELNPGLSENLRCAGRCLQQSSKLSEAGATLLAGLSSGPDQPTEQNYLALLSATRRKRDYFVNMRTVNAKLGEGTAGSLLKCKPSIFDQRKMFDDGSLCLRTPEAPRLRVSHASSTAICVHWTEPDNGGDEIYIYSLQLSAFQVVWDAKKGGLLEGYKPFEVVVEYPVQALEEDEYEYVIENLRPENDFKIRVCARNSLGPSHWSEEVHARTQQDEQDKTMLDDALPASWLRVDFSDLVNEHIEFSGDETPHEFFYQLAFALQPRVHSLSRIFKSLRAAGKADDKGITKSQFMGLAKRLCVVSGQESGGALPAGLYRVSVGVLELIFQRSNLQALAKRRRMVQQEGQFRDLDNVQARQFADEVVDELIAQGMPITLTAEDTTAIFAKGDNVLVLHEFIGSLVRLAWSCFTHGASGNGSSATSNRECPLTERIEPFMDLVLLPACAKMIEREDPFERVLRTARVQAIIEYYKKQLFPIYCSYAQADKSDEDAETINLKEIIYMYKEGAMFDEGFSLPQLIEIFTLVNQTFEELSEDADETELIFDEFVSVVARTCDVKIPEAKRGGGGFELTLQSWLHLYFIPKYEALMKEKRRGTIKKTL